jgi:hypothetical protein
LPSKKLPVNSVWNKKSPLDFKTKVKAKNRSKFTKSVHQTPYSICQSPCAKSVKFFEQKSRAKMLMKLMPGVHGTAHAFSRLGGLGLGFISLIIFFIGRFEK